MEEFEYMIEKSFANYFGILSTTGYINDKDVGKFAMLNMLVDVLKDFEGLVSQHDYDKIYSIISCIGKSVCFIPQLPCKPNYEVVGTQLRDTPIKISEDEDIRNAQIDVQRLTEKHL